MMGFRLRRSIRVLPGLRLNVGKRGASVSIGGRGAHVALGHGQVRETVSLPGTGLSYTTVHKTHGEAVGADQAPAAPKVPAERRPLSLGRALAALLVFLVMVALLINLVRTLAR